MAQWPIPAEPNLLSWVCMGLPDSEAANHLHLPPPSLIVTLHATPCSTSRRTCAQESAGGHLFINQSLFFGVFFLISDKLLRWLKCQLFERMKEKMFFFLFFLFSFLSGDGEQTNIEISCLNLKHRIKEHVFTDGVLTRSC